MNTNTLDNIPNRNFDVVKHYINTGDSKALSPEVQHQLDICIVCYGLLRQFPQRGLCIKRLQALYSHEQMQYKTAAQYVDFTRKTWGDFMGNSKEFLKDYFLAQVLNEISNPNASSDSRAKNLATLEKYIEKLPENTIDPKLMEQNNIFIQINAGEKNLALSEKVIGKLPTKYREMLLNSISDEVTDESAAEILNS